MKPTYHSNNPKFAEYLRDEDAVKQLMKDNQYKKEILRAIGAMMFWSLLMVFIFFFAISLLS